MRLRLMRLAAPALLAAAINVGHAQRDPAALPRDRELDSIRVAAGPELTQSREQGSAGGAIVAGMGLGLVGFLAGSLAGAGIARGCTAHEFCELEGAFYGAAAGGTLGMALGVHLGNRRRGNFALDLLTGAAVWATGIGIAAATDDETVLWIAFVTIPVAQLATTVAVERAVGRSRSRRRDVRLSPVWHREAGPGLRAAITF